MTTALEILDSVKLTTLSITLLSPYLLTSKMKQFYISDPVLAGEVREDPAMTKTDSSL